MISQKKFVILTAVFIVILSVAVVEGQIASVGFRFINVQQIKFHQKMLDGIAGNPWQYRIFSDILLVPFRSIFWRLGIPNPDASAFISFRFVQSLLILTCAEIYYKKLGINPFLNFIGLSILAWGMSNSLYNSELSFNTFFDIAFFLVAAILILGFCIRKQIYNCLNMIIIDSVQAFIIHLNNIPDYPFNEGLRQIFQGGNLKTIIS